MDTVAKYVGSTDDPPAVGRHAARVVVGIQGLTQAPRRVFVPVITRAARITRLDVSGLPASPTGSITGALAQGAAGDETGRGQRLGGRVVQMPSLAADAVTPAPIGYTSETCQCTRLPMEPGAPWRTIIADMFGAAEWPDMIDALAHLSPEERD